MSLDHRLREGLGGCAEDMLPDVETLLSRTKTRFRWRRIVRRAAAASVLVLGVALALPTLATHLTKQTRTQPGSPPTSAQARVLLEGRWDTGTVTSGQVARTLADAGLGAYSDAVVAEQGYPTSWVLFIDKGTYSVWSKTGTLTDIGSWSVEGTLLRLHPSCTGCEVDLAWHIDGSTLRLHLVSDPSTDLSGVPDAAFAQALYGTAPFVKEQPAQVCPAPRIGALTPCQTTTAGP